jgi:hypothetical protein
MSKTRADLQHKMYDASIMESVRKPPQQVKIAPHLHDDIQALDVLFNPAESPLCLFRPSRTTVANYMFDDASGGGFGSSFFVDHDLHFVPWPMGQGQYSRNFQRQRIIKS